METLTPISKTSSKASKIGAIIFLVIGVVGFLDATYLALDSIRGVVPACFVVTGCNRVLLSSYAKVAGVPLSYFGMAYYLVVIGGALLYLDIKKRPVLHLLSGLTLLGILASAYFVYLQAFVIRAFCTYCLFSALTSTLLFLNGLFVFIKTEPTEDSSLTGKA